MKKDRKVVLDTETTGMNFTGCFYENHRIIEIGAVEIINNHITGNNFHSYIFPERSIDKNAFKIHGISSNFLSCKPKFSEIIVPFLTYLDNSDLIIHNSKFDIGFINYELSMLKLNVKNISENCNIIDTLSMARKIFPGKKNTLDSLCTRYKIDITNRTIHSAIYDAKLLAKVYIFMTNFQKSLPIFDNNVFENYLSKKAYSKHARSKILLATEHESISHKNYLKYMMNISGKCIWLTE
ncbi:MAG: DNA polymerase III subunit epsilon [Buchnera aphidicola (Schlechtendalia chinensis)]